MTSLTGAFAPLADCWHHGGWGGPWFLIVWIVLIVFVVWVFRRGGWCRPGRHHHRQSAAEALEHRFARGEIDDEEFRRRRSVLGDGDEK
jgi:putative membrane protein